MSSISLTPRTPRVAEFFPPSDILSPISSDEKKNYGDFEPQKIDPNKVSYRSIGAK